MENLEEHLENDHQEQLENDRKEPLENRRIYNMMRQTALKVTKVFADGGKNVYTKAGTTPVVWYVSPVGLGEGDIYAHKAAFYSIEKTQKPLILGLNWNLEKSLALVEYYDKMEDTDIFILRVAKAVESDMSKFESVIESAMQKNPQTKYHIFIEDKIKYEK